MFNKEDRKAQFESLTEEDRIILRRINAYSEQVLG